MVFVTVKTLNDSKGTYDGVSMRTRNGEKKVWNSGDFTKDWYKLNRYICLETEIWKEGYHIPLPLTTLLWTQKSMNPDG